MGAPFVLQNRSRVRRHLWSVGQEQIRLGGKQRNFHRKVREGQRRLGGNVLGVGRTLVTVAGFGVGESIPRRNPDGSGGRQETGIRADPFGSGLASQQACDGEKGFKVYG